MLVAAKPRREAAKSGAKPQDGYFVTAVLPQSGCKSISFLLFRYKKRASKLMPRDSFFLDSTSY
jgi:hypothetical protein